MPDLDARTLAEWAGLRPGQRVLEIGAGPGEAGTLLRSLVGPGGSVTSLDAQDGLDGGRFDLVLASTAAPTTCC